MLIINKHFLTKASFVYSKSEKSFSAYFGYAFNNSPLCRPGLSNFFQPQQYLLHNSASHPLLPSHAGPPPAHSCERWVQGFTQVVCWALANHMQAVHHELASPVLAPNCNLLDVLVGCTPDFCCSPFAKHCTWYKSVSQSVARSLP